MMDLFSDSLNNKNYQQTKHINIKHYLTKRKTKLGQDIFQYINKERLFQDQRVRE